jgi:hypothetical protein
MFNQGTSTDTKVAVLEEKVSIYEKVMSRIEDAIFAISETSQGISKMLAIHEERLEQAVRSDEVIIKMIDDLKKTVEAEDVDLSDRIDEIVEKSHDRMDTIDKKVEEIKKIKWMTVGVGLFAAVIAGAISTLASGLLTPSEMGIKMEHRYVPSPENITK